MDDRSCSLRLLVVRVYCTRTLTTSEYPNHDYWNAKSEEDVDLDAPFYEDQLSGFSGALVANRPIQGSCAEVDDGGWPV